jgi:16S rRNA (cytosine1402-N4)-methyltransferase
MFTHSPVLMQEVTDLMNLIDDGVYIDATFGRGGHAKALLEKLSINARLMAFDRDPEAESAAKIFSLEDPRLEFFRGPFSQLDRVTGHAVEKVDGILFDLGVSSPQLDDPNRGFSFRFEGPLDMRMDPSCEISAATWVNSASEIEISDVLWNFGDERKSRHIARKILAVRAVKPIETTKELATIIRSCFRYQGGRLDPATRSFQAIRVHVNDEVREIEKGLESALKLLAINGRLLIISFHSLEDRLVKHKFKNLDLLTKNRGKDKELEAPAYRIVKPNLFRATEAEKAVNPRSRSAKLRVIERCL